MDTTKLTPNHRHILDLMSQIEKTLESDSYYLTRGDQDSIFYRLQGLKEFVNETYGRRLPNGI